MNIAWRRLLPPLTPGVRGLLLVLAGFYLAGAAGQLSGAYHLGQWLGLSGAGFWKGRIWPLFTYSLLSGSLAEFLCNGLLLLVMGASLERAWSARRLWSSCLVATLGAGLAKILVQPTNPSVLTGATPIVLGLAVAWAMLFGHERMLFFMVWDMSVRQAALLMAALTLATALPSAGFGNTAIMLCGGLAVLLEWWLRSKILRSRPAQPVVSERMGRLEL